MASGRGESLTVAPSQPLALQLDVPVKCQSRWRLHLAAVVHGTRTESSWTGTPLPALAPAHGHGVCENVKQRAPFWCRWHLQLEVHVDELKVLPLLPVYFILLSSDTGHSDGDTFNFKLKPRLCCHGCLTLWLPCSSNTSQSCQCRDTLL